MKLFLILIFTSAVIFISCKCNCDGDAPVISPKNKKLLIFKKDSVIDFIRNQSDIVKVNVSVNPINYENHSETVCTDPLNLFTKNCDCPGDYMLTSGYEQWSTEDSISFRLFITTNKNGSSISYTFNQNYFYEFDNTNISKTINNKLLTGLSLKEFTNSSDSVSQIYYKDSLGLVSVVYKNGTTVDLK